MALEMFNTYFDSNISMRSCNASLYNILSTVAERYIGQNPAGTFRFRAYRDDSFLPDADGSYNLDLNSKLPEAKLGQYALIAAKFYHGVTEKERF